MSAKSRCAAQSKAAGDGEEQAMTGEVIDTRMANALFANAAMSKQAAAAIAKFAGHFSEGAKLGLKTAQSTLDTFAQHYGGLWVGGNATLTDQALTFEPNALNHFIHENGDALRLDLALTEIDLVATRFGWFTGIIDITTHGAVFSMRCYGSKSFAASIVQARTSALG
jgi:hypothetical protein